MEQSLGLQWWLQLSTAQAQKDLGPGSRPTWLLWWCPKLRPVMAEVHESHMGLKILHTYKSSMITSMIAYKWSLIWLVKLYKTIYDDLMFLHFSWRLVLLRISPGSSVSFVDPRCGGGNAAQVVSCLFGSRYKVTAISLFADEAEKWDKAVKEAGGMTCNFQGTTKAAPWRTNFGHELRDVTR